MPTGRPRELTQSIIDRTADLVKRCLYVETVAASLGIHRDTFNEWSKAGSREQRRRDQGKEPDAGLDLHVAFSGTIKRALAEAEGDYLSCIQAAGADAWQALAWILERRFPERWATNRGELRALAKQIAALANQGSGGGVPRKAAKKTGATEVPGK